MYRNTSNPWNCAKGYWWVSYTDTWHSDVLCHGAAVLVEKSDIAFCFLCSKCNEAGLKFVFMRIFQEPNLCATQRFGSWNTSCFLSIEQAVLTVSFLNMHSIHRLARAAHTLVARYKWASQAQYALLQMVVFRQWYPLQHRSRLISLSRLQSDILRCPCRC